MRQHRLRAGGGKIDNGKPSVAEAGCSIAQLLAFAPGAAMTQTDPHSLQRGLRPVEPTRGQKTTDAAHRLTESRDALTFSSMFRLVKQLTLRG